MKKLLLAVIILLLIAGGIFFVIPKQPNSDELVIGGFPVYRTADRKTATLAFAGLIPAGEPDDGDTFYLGGYNAAGGYSAIDQYYEVIVPVTGTITHYSIMLDATAANTTSNETASVYIRKNGSDTLLNNAAVFSVSSGTGYYAGGAVPTQLSVTAGDRITIKIVAPTFATDPDDTYYTYASLVITY